MDSGRTSANVLDVVGVPRNSDDSASIDAEVGLATAPLQEAPSLHYNCVEIMKLRPSAVEPTNHCMAAQSPQPQQEAELTNVSVIADQTERFRLRLGFRES